MKRTRHFAILFRIRITIKMIMDKVLPSKYTETQKTIDQLVAERERLQKQMDVNSRRLREEIYRQSQKMK